MVVVPRHACRAGAADERGRLGRDLSYLYVLLVARIIVAAVGSELVIAHPRRRLDGAEFVGLAVGPVRYLLAELRVHYLLRGGKARREERRLREWEAAMADARARYAEHMRAEAPTSQVERWRTVAEIRAYCDAIEERYPGGESAEWVARARR